MRMSTTLFHLLPLLKTHSQNCWMDLSGGKKSPRQPGHSPSLGPAVPVSVTLRNGVKNEYYSK